MSGNAVHAAALGVKEKAIRIAAKKLEVAEEDLRLANGRVELVGAPGLNLTLGAIAPEVAVMRTSCLAGELGSATAQLLVHRALPRLVQLQRGPHERRDGQRFRKYTGLRSRSQILPLMRLCRWQPRKSKPS